MLIKIITYILIITFPAENIAWAGVPDKLAPQSVFQFNKGTANAAIRTAVDMRPVDNRLLDAPFVGHDMAIKQVVNPYDKPLTGIYGGAGSDISNFLLSTNASVGYFVDINYGAEEGGLDNVLFEMYANAYRSGKYSVGYAQPCGPEFSNFDAILLELRAIGVVEDEVRNIESQRKKYMQSENGMLIEFNWAYPGQAPRKRSIYLIRADITKPSLCPAILNDILSKGVDFYYQRAGMNIPFAYTNFLERIALSLSPDGFMAIDAETVEEKVNPLKYLAKTNMEEIPPTPEIKYWSGEIREQKQFKYGWNIKLYRRAARTGNHDVDAGEEYRALVEEVHSSDFGRLKRIVEAARFKYLARGITTFVVYEAEDDKEFPFVVKIPGDTIPITELKKQMEFAKRYMGGIMAPFTVLEDVKVNGILYPIVMVQEKMHVFREEKILPQYFTLPNGEEINLWEKEKALIERLFELGIYYSDALIPVNYGLDLDTGQLYLIDFGMFTMLEDRDSEDGSAFRDVMPEGVKKRKTTGEKEYCKTLREGLHFDMINVRSDDELYVLWGTKRHEARPTPDISLKNEAAKEILAQGSGLSANKMTAVPSHDEITNEDYRRYSSERRMGQYMDIEKLYSLRRRTTGDNFEFVVGLQRMVINAGQVMRDVTEIKKLLDDSRDALMNAFGMQFLDQNAYLREWMSARGDKLDPLLRIICRDMRVEDPRADVGVMEKLIEGIEDYYSGLAEYPGLNILPPKIYRTVRPTGIRFMPDEFVAEDTDDIITQLRKCGIRFRTVALRSKGFLWPRDRISWISEDTYVKGVLPTEECSLAEGGAVIPCSGKKGRFVLVSDKIRKGSADWLRMNVAGLEVVVVKSGFSTIKYGDVLYHLPNGHIDNVIGFVSADLTNDNRNKLLVDPQYFKFQEDVLKRLAEEHDIDIVLVDRDELHLQMTNFSIIEGHIIINRGEKTIRVLNLKEGVAIMPSVANTEGAYHEYLYRCRTNLLPEEIIRTLIPIDISGEKRNGEDRGGGRDVHEELLLRAV